MFCGEAFPLLDKVHGDLFVPYSHGRLASLLLLGGDFNGAIQEAHKALEMTCAVVKLRGLPESVTFAEWREIFQNDPVSRLAPEEYAQAVFGILPWYDEGDQLTVRKALDLAEILAGLGHDEHAEAILDGVVGLFQAELASNDEMHERAQALRTELADGSQ